MSHQGQLPTPNCQLPNYQTDFPIPKPVIWELGVVGWALSPNCNPLASPTLQCPAMRYRLLTALVTAGAVGSSSAPVAQQGGVHLNPVVAKLAAGQTVYGLINSGDLSLVNARETARAPVDFVYADMEHNPLDFPGLATFLVGMTDKAAIRAKGNLQANVALFARF